MFFLYQKNQIKLYVTMSTIQFRQCLLAITGEMNYVTRFFLTLSWTRCCSMVAMSLATIQLALIQDVILLYIEQRLYPTDHISLFTFLT